MRNFIKAGFVALIAGTVMISACSDKSSTMNNTGAGGSGAGGTTGGTDAGSDTPDQTGAGGSTGAGGAGGAAPSAHQDHLSIINAATTGGITVTRSAPVSYDTCKI